MKGRCIDGTEFWVVTKLQPVNNQVIKGLNSTWYIVEIRDGKPYAPICTVKAPYAIGEKLYCKEAWSILYCGSKVQLKTWEYSRPIEILEYEPQREDGYWWNKRSPALMPKWAARKFVVVTDVKAQRLQEITEEDAERLGFKSDKIKIWWQGYRRVTLGELGEELMHQQSIGDKPPDWMIEPHRMLERPDLLWTARRFISIKWDSKHPKHPWSSNPWCWHYTVREAKS